MFIILPIMHRVKNELKKQQKTTPFVSSIYGRFSDVCEI